jgi:DNA anti-recombination protein RmuC
MNTAILSASAGLIGSLIGGVSTFAASWVTQHKLLGTQTRMQHARQRQKLYSEFIIEATRCLTEAWNHQAQGPEVVSNLYSAVERMRLVSSNRVVKCAEEVMRGVIAAYAESNRTIDELRQRVQQSSEEHEPLREFTEACRQELNSRVKALDTLLEVIREVDRARA